MRNQKISLSALTKSESEAIRAEANLTEEQERIFSLLSRDIYNDDGIILILNISRRRYYRAKHVLCDKIARILREKGYIFAIK